LNQELYNQALSIWSKGPRLDDDYHKSTGFLSNSFISAFQKCQYSAIIKYAGLGVKEGFNQNFAVGHLSEAKIFEGQKGFDKMLKRYESDAIGRGGKPYKWVNDCIEYADSVLKHNSLKKLLQHKDSKYHQVLTFELHGFKWRGEVDFMNLSKKAEVDLKTTSDSFDDRSYNKETRQYDLTFIDKWNYYRQRALYQYGIKQEFDIEVIPHILAISKKNKSVRLFSFENDQDRLDYELEQLELICQEIEEVLKGEMEPQQCETCAQCVQDEQINFAIDTSTYCAEWYR
jgi:hypothetical protein